MKNKEKKNLKKRQSKTNQKKDLKIPTWQKKWMKGSESMNNEEDRYLIGGIPTNKYRELLRLAKLLKEK